MAWRKNANLVFATLLIAGAPLSIAAAPSTPASPPPCWSDLTRGVVTCYPVGTDVLGAITAATGHSPIVETSVSRGNAEYQSDVVAAPNVTIVQSIWYADINYAGSSYVATVSSDVYECYNGYIHSFNLAGSSWNDRISSFHSYRLCQTKLYENSDRSGSTYGYLTDSSNVGGAMNDRASYVRVEDPNAQ